MPKYFCDYCNVYLAHDSASARKTHNKGYKHKANVAQWYAQYAEPTTTPTTLTPTTATATTQQGIPSFTVAPPMVVPQANPNFFQPYNNRYPAQAPIPMQSQPYHQPYLLQTNYQQRK